MSRWIGSLYISVGGRVDNLKIWDGYGVNEVLLAEQQIAWADFVKMLDDRFKLDFDRWISIFASKPEFKRFFGAMGAVGA